MSKEILLVVDAIANEKGVEQEVIFEAIEAALASATQKRHEGEIAARVAVDRRTGDYETFRRWEVVEDDDELEFPDQQIPISQARGTDPTIEVGGFIEEPMESVDFGRIAAQTAKQVIVQKVRDAERAQVVEAYRDRVGELITGIVKQRIPGSRWQCRGLYSSRGYDSPRGGAPRRSSARLVARGAGGGPWAAAVFQPLRPGVPGRAVQA